MPPQWLVTVRSMLLGQQHNAKPRRAQLELLKVAFHFDDGLYTWQNLNTITEFLGDDQRQAETRSMAALFDLKISAEACAKYTSSLLIGWIKDDLWEQAHADQTVCPRVLVERWETFAFREPSPNLWLRRKPEVRIQHDSVSRKRDEALARLQCRTTGGYLGISVVIRKENLSGTLVTSAELYTLIWMASDQALREPHRNVLEVCYSTQYCLFTRC